jgi:hypothetical protein
MAQAASTSSNPEPTLEIIPDGSKLTVAITLDRFTTFQISGWTDQILDLAKAIVAADSKWMPANIRTFAQDALAFRRARVFPIDDDPESLNAQAADEQESEQARKTLEALKQLRSFVRGVFYDASERLKKQAIELGEDERPTTIQ